MTRWTVVIGLGLGALATCACVAWIGAYEIVGAVFAHLARGGAS